MPPLHSDDALPGLAIPADDDTSLSPRIRIPDAVIKRFFSRLVRAPGDGCWIWTGAISSPDGYGRITWQVDKRSYSMSTHRFALLVSGLGVEDGLIAEHCCDEPLCCRVGDGHLRWSSQSENLHHAVEAGRHRGRKKTMNSHERVDRSRRVRAALQEGWDARAYARAVSNQCPGQLELFEF